MKTGITGYGSVGAPVGVDFAAVASILRHALRDGVHAGYGRDFILQQASALEAIAQHPAAPDVSELVEALETCLEMEERPKVIERARAAIAAARQAAAGVSEEIMVIAAHDELRVQAALLRTPEFMAQFDPEKFAGQLERIAYALASAPRASAPAAVAAIQFALTDPEGVAFLRLWNEGEFDTIRREWPDAPSEVYVGADPLVAQQQQGQQQGLTMGAAHGVGLPVLAMVDDENRDLRPEEYR